MSFSTELLSLMDSTISVSTRGAHNNYGEPSFSTAVTTYRARVVHSPGYERSGEGEGIEYSHVLWVASTGSVSITASDRITLPDGTRPTIARVERLPDETGPHHVKIWCGGGEIA